MSVDTTQKFRDAFLALLSPDLTAAGITLIDGIMSDQFRYAFHQAADAAANTATGTFTPDQATNTSFRVKTFKMIPSSAITSANTNTATIALVYNNGNGGSDTTIATANTATTAGGGTGDIAASVAYSFTINATNAVVPSGSQLQVKITKQSSGIQLPVVAYEIKGAPTTTA